MNGASDTRTRADLILVIESEGCEREADSGSNLLEGFPSWYQSQHGMSSTMRASF